jgi:hypothetical protein
MLVLQRRRKRRTIAPNLLLLKGLPRQESETNQTAQHNRPARSRVKYFVRANAQHTLHRATGKHAKADGRDVCETVNKGSLASAGEEH